jgi:hypothetical protein
MIPGSNPGDRTTLPLLPVNENSLDYFVVFRFVAPVVFLSEKVEKLQ